MTVNEILDKYLLSDGYLNSMEVQYDLKYALIIYTGRKIVGKGQAKECCLKISLSDVRKIFWSEDFLSKWCTDITLYPLDSGEIYLSFDPFGNTGKPNSEDNMVIISGSIEITEVGNTLDEINLS